MDDPDTRARLPNLVQFAFRGKVREEDTPIRSRPFGTISGPTFWMALRPLQWSTVEGIKISHRVAENAECLVSEG